MSALKSTPSSRLDDDAAPVPAAEKLPRSIPIEILRDRGELTVHQALAHWLCDDPQGPKVSHAQAAELLGIKHRQEISKHLERARDVRGRR